MKRSARELLDSREFRHLVSRRWTVSLVLTLALFVTYYGYILLIAWNKPLMARKLGAAVTLGIPAGAGVILVSWVLTSLYVAWANRTYDAEVSRLKGQLDE